MPTDFSPLWISLKTAALATLLTFGLGVPAAYWMLNFQGRAKTLIEGIFLMPLILPPTVTGFLLLLLFGKSGPFTGIVALLGTPIVFTWYAAVIAATVVAFPLMYKTTLGAFEQVDPALLQVARTLGASEWKVFWQITVPLSRPGLMAAVTLAFARALGEFGATLMLAGNIPGQTQTIPMAIYFAVEGGALWEAWFWTGIIAGISIIGLTVVDRYRSVQALGRQKPICTIVTALSAVTKIQLVNPESDHQNPTDRVTHSKCASGITVSVCKELVSFRLEVHLFAEQTLGILGASGAGKSMLLRCIAGIETPNTGQIMLNGRMLFNSETGINVPIRDRRLGFLVQNYALFPHMTVAENIAFGLPSGLSRAEIRAEISEQLGAVQLENLEHFYPQQLSGGQQQRVALARALASRPEALLLDEPFSALDTYLRSQLEQTMIARLARYSGSTLLVTHNLEEAYRICQNLLVLDRGRAIAQDSKHSIFDRPSSFRVAQLTGCKNFSQAIIRADGKIDALDWDCTLEIVDKNPLSQTIQYVGIRAHQISFRTGADQPNSFPGWVVEASETPHRVTLFLRLHHPPDGSGHYHLQVELFKEKWLLLKSVPIPWNVCLQPDRLILMTEAE
jgi:molybdate ABC transporter permease protein